MVPSVHAAVPRAPPSSAGHEDRQSAPREISTIAPAHAGAGRKARIAWQTFNH